MATYAERLTVLQGVAPERIHVVTGDGVSRPWRLIDVAAYARRARARLETFVGRAAGHRPLADRLLRAVPLGRAVQHRAAAGRRPRPGRLHARRPPRRAAGGRASRRWHALATATPELLKSSGIGADARTRLQQQAAEQLRERTDRAAVAHAARPAARPRAAAAAAAEPRRPLPRLRGRPLVRGRRGHRVPRRPRRPVGRVHRAVGARPAGGEADGRRPDRPAGRGGARPTRACTSTTTRPTR